MWNVFYTHEVYFIACLILFTGAGQTDAMLEMVVIFIRILQKRVLG